VPFWPLGLPGWDDEWVAHGLHDGTSALVTVWRRGGSSSNVLALPGWAQGLPVRVVYPVATDASVAMADGVAALEITLPHDHQAVTIAIGRD